MFESAGASPSSDADLLARGEASIGLLFDRHSRPVFRLALSLLGNVADAQDVTQDTFILAWRKSARIRLVGDSALPWLLAAARLIALTHLRGHRRRHTENIDTLEPSVLQRPQNETDVTDLVGDAMRALSPSDREVVELVLIDGISYSDAARHLGLTPAATGKRLERARKRLQSRITSERNTEGA